MTNNKGAVLLPESQLTDEELENVSGGLLTTIDVGLKPLPLPLPGTLLRMERPQFSLAGACGSGTDDSGAMGCPG